MIRLIVFMFIARYLVKSLEFSYYCDKEDNNTLEMDNRLIQRFKESLQEHHLIFIGDSLTRFHFIAIVYAVKYGHFMRSDIYPDPTFRRKYPSNHDFYINTTALFGPNSYCDCHFANILYKPLIENRYYWDSSFKFNMTYLLYYGKCIWRSSHRFVISSCVGEPYINGHWADNGDRDIFREPRVDYLEPFWRISIHKFFETIPKSWILKPTAVVFNVGLHVDHVRVWESEEYIRSVVNSSHQTAPIFIYRTTTYDVRTKYASEFPYEFRDQYFCKLPTVRCMNVSWTRCLPESSYIDHHHFIIEPYNQMARQFMLTWLHTQNHMDWFKSCIEVLLVDDEGSSMTNLFIKLTILMSFIFLRLLDALF